MVSKEEKDVQEEPSEEEGVKKSEEIIKLTRQYGAMNYDPLPVVISKAKGVWVKDVDGNKYMDMLSAYSAVSHGHCHPEGS